MVQTKIFDPFLNGDRIILYDERLYYFAISFLWRVLQFEYDMYNLKEKWFYTLIRDVDEEWKNFLRNGTRPNRFHNVNIFCVERDFIKQHNNLEGVDSYLTRALDQTIIHSLKDESILLIYGKFNRFVFWSVIKDSTITDDLYSYEINPNGGYLNFPEEIEYSGLGRTLISRIKETQPLVEQMSEQQNRKIYERIEKDGFRFFNTDAGIAYLNDLRIKKEI